MTTLYDGSALPLYLGSLAGDGILDDETLNQVGVGEGDIACRFLETICLLPAGGYSVGVTWSVITSRAEPRAQSTRHSQSLRAEEAETRKMTGWLKVMR